MESVKHCFALALILAAAGSPVMADPTSCPAGDYGGEHMKFIGYRESDGYVTFAVKENNGSLKASTEYWLSNYKVDSPRAKTAYTAGLAATTEGSAVWIHCDGTTSSQIYVYSDD